VGTPFTLLRMAVPEFTTVYTEGLTGSAYSDATDDVDAYRLAFRRLSAAALANGESLAMLDRRIRELV